MSFHIFYIDVYGNSNGGVGIWIHVIEQNKNKFC